MFAITSVWTARRDGAKKEKLAGRLLAVDLQAFRRALPAQLLTIHVDIIQDTLSTSPATAKAHIGLIRESGFEDREIRDAMNQIYRLAVGAKKNAAAEQAIQAIDAYLKVDPRSTRALQDRLQVAIRVCENRDNPYSARVAAMKAARAQATTLKTCAKPSDSDYDRSAEVLRDFFLAWGEACNVQAVGMPGSGRNVNDLFREAFELVEQACEFERTGVSAQELLCTVAANISKTCEEAVKESARLLDRALKKYPKRARLVLARLRVRLYEGEFGQVDRELSKAEQLNLVSRDPHAEKDASEVRQLAEYARDFGNLQALDLLIEAQKLMEQRNWSAALTKLRAGRNAQPRETKATIAFVSDMFTCYEKTFDTNGQAECARDFQRLKDRFG